VVAKCVSDTSSTKKSPPLIHSSRRWARGKGDGKIEGRIPEPVNHRDWFRKTYGFFYCLASGLEFGGTSYVRTPGSSFLIILTIGPPE
jgi:hypothetical protein